MESLMAAYKKNSWKGLKKVEKQNGVLEERIFKKRNQLDLENPGQTRLHKV